MAKVVNFGSTEGKVKEFIGLCKALTCDRNINSSQMYFLRKWIEEHEDILNVASVGKVAEKLNSVLVNSAIYNAEKTELVELLGDFSKKIFDEEFECEIRQNALPLDCFGSEIVIDGAKFFLGGDFKYVKESFLREFIIAHGGIISDDFDESINFLVLGLGRRNRDVIHDLNETLARLEELKVGGAEVKTISERMIIRNLD